MKKISSVLFGFFFSVITLSAASVTSTTQPIPVSKQEIMHITAESMYLMQTITKDYLYLGTNTESTLLNKEMKNALIDLDRMMVQLKRIHSQDPAMEQLLGCISLGRDELRSIMEESYSADNMKLVLEVTGLISEAALRISHAIENNSMVAYKCDSKALIPCLSSL